MADLVHAAKRRLGGSGLAVAPLGLGCMSLSGTYGPSDDAASERLLHHAIDAGVDFIDSSDMYGWGHNETLLSRVLAGRRDEVVLATKFGQVKSAGPLNAVDGRPEYVQQACEASLKRLGVEAIDLYYQHRIDPSVPIEDTVGAMAKLVQQGKVRAIGLCEANPGTIRRAHAVHPLAAVQSEYSLLYRRDAEETRRTTSELGIAYVAYSPLGRSLLTGAARGLADIPEGDGRRRQPRFADANIARNLELVGKLAGFAGAKGCTPGQLALAWLLALGDDIVPIPGTKRIERLDENLGAIAVTLTADEVARLAAAIPADAAAGTRYPEAQMHMVHI